MNKKDMAEYINDFIDTNRCLGGGINRVIISIYSKYDILKQENQDYFLDKIYNDESIYNVYDAFKDTTTSLLEHYNNKYGLDLSYFGFVGRSGGHFVVEIGDLYYIDNLGDYSYTEIKALYKKCLRYEKIKKELTAHLCDFFNGEVEYLKEQEVNNIIKQIKELKEQRKGIMLEQREILANTTPKNLSDFADNILTANLTDNQNKLRDIKNALIGLIKEYKVLVNDYNVERVNVFNKYL